MNENTDPIDNGSDGTPEATGGPANPSATGAAAGHTPKAAADTPAAASDAPAVRDIPAATAAYAPTTAHAPTAAHAPMAAHAPTAAYAQTPAPAGTESSSAASHTGGAFRRPRLGFLIGGATALALGIGAAGIGVGLAISPSSSTSTSASGTITASDPTTIPPDTTTPDTTDGSTDGSTGGPQAYAQPGTYQPRGTESTSTTDATPATDEQQVGVVTIVSTLYYDDSSQAAGTGIILSSTGEILTNNHVIEGATSIEVTVESTGETYTAEVVGTDATSDVAVLQLEDASGLTPATLGDSDDVAVSDAIASVGNAEGTGDLVTAAGTITALDESIEVASETSDTTESLSGLIEIDADVVSGDSGGPLVDADGDVVGIVTAASSGTADITGYAIEINTALDIVNQIESGVDTDTVVIGLPAFLGVTIADTTSTDGVVLGGVVEGLPADEAGLVAGDTITAVDGESVTTYDSLSEIVAAHEAGDSVTVTYTDTSGDSQTVTVTLVEGPAA